MPIFATAPTKFFSKKRLTRAYPARHCATAGHCNCGRGLPRAGSSLCNRRSSDQRERILAIAR